MNFGMLCEPKDDSNVLIECRDVYKSFGDKHILRGVSFKVIICNYFSCFNQYGDPFTYYIIISLSTYVQF